MKKYFLGFVMLSSFIYCCGQSTRDPEYDYNEKVVSQLVKAGDNLSAPRKVSHWIYFHSENERKTFIEFIQTKGYNIDNTNYVKQDKFPYSVTISKTNMATVEAMIPITKELKAIAKKYGGDYDGWESSVEK